MLNRRGRPPSKITFEQACLVRARYRPGLGGALGREYGISAGHVRAIARGTYHRQPSGISLGPVLTAGQVADIRRRYVAGPHGIGRQLAQEYGVHPMLICRVTRDCRVIKRRPRRTTAAMPTSESVPTPSALEVVRAAWAARLRA